LDGADLNGGETSPDSPALAIGKEPESELDFSIPEEASAETSVDDMIKRETRQGRQVNLLLIIIFAILVTSGAIFLLLTSGNGNIPASDAIRTVQKGTAETGRPGERATAPGKDPIKEKSPPQVAARMRAGEKIESVQTDSKPEGQVEKKAPTTSRPFPSSGAPLQSLRNGRYHEAAQTWRSQMADEMSGFSILLELDCLPASVGAAFSRIHEPDRFFLLPRKRGDRTCYLVMWGRFSSEDSARKALSSLPAYFLNQDPPAKVIDLATYR
ncbi:MAG: hypothetical protein JXA62_08970, partial [Candidatus Aminicenantes bacterium]|nr:hypothetical protein [Candidatus Aminicenantes bacterium]